MVKRVLTLAIVFSLSLCIYSVVQAKPQYKSKTYNVASLVTPNSNFFTQTPNKTPIEIPEVGELERLGYELVAENHELELYLLRNTLGIAVRVKDTGYIWYSVYKDYKRLVTTGKARQFIESGVSIEYFDSTTLNEAQEYVSNPSASVELTYTLNEKGFHVHVKFTKLGISFDIEVYIEGKELFYRVIHESIVEVPYQSPAMKTPKEYKIKAIYVFPYFGSQNYEINGYSFIPDGSGALIRYTNVPSSTAYVKRVFGDDPGIVTPTRVYDHLKDEATVNLAIYGVNHGYNQAAFLAEVISGMGNAELHSYPYNYNNVRFNTTFFKDIVREKFVVRMSTTDTTGLPIITEKPYPSDFIVRFSFLSHEDANYVGMAKKYRDNLELKTVRPQENVPLRLDIIGLDFKPSLFGKSYITMTTYKDVIAIMDDLNKQNINNVEVIYIGWNKGGFYDNTPIKPKVARQLGGKDDFLAMQKYFDEHNLDIFYYDNPIIAFTTNFNNRLVKKMNLSLSTTRLPTPLFDEVYYLNYEDIGETVLRYKKTYNKLKIDKLAFDFLGEKLYSYLYKSKTHYRDDAIREVIQELEELNDFEIALFKANSYTYPYISSNYDMYYESNKYTYITDSVPFIPLVLSGHIEMYSPHINFMSDYQLISLRLIEYNIYPSFIITKEPTHKLRYTNSEWVYTSEYNLWRNQINETYHFINDSLRHVVGNEMINHEYIAQGICKVTYDNGVEIYINYTNSDFNHEDFTIPSLNVVVRGGDNS
ncbi:MAG: hypothetical protein GX490_10350 [Bacilli bacterium]|nr:hypothetical protein [Bacilli bacterium]